GFRYSVGVFLLLAQWRPSQHKVAPRQLLREMRLPLALDTGIGSMCFVYGIAHTDLALGATLSSLSPLVALPVAAVMRTERVTVGKAAAVCLTLAGVILLVSSA
ncbi:MAG TPA: EamA family transporter, partial [Polyangiales bacterium]|nr:EamA family transporter [Polyangiales bacterium]